jgi:hypothetical protein
MNLAPIFEHFKLDSPKQICPLTGGANNRVYKLEFDSQGPLILKQYFQHSQDLRPRLTAEFSFLQYAWQIGIRNIPQPLLASTDLNVALYSFLPGRPIQPTDISDAVIQQMISFFLALNQQRSEAIRLPTAAESCFSIDDFIQITEKRVDRLKNGSIDTPIERDFYSFFTNDLIPKWEILKETKCKAALHLRQSVETSDRCITPSDFGFHNALIDNGEIAWIDFEYAGWDDPCKTVCDLFCQPRIPLPSRYFAQISHAICSVSQEPEKCMKRIDLIFPVIQMKWCCILLNTFTQVGRTRRNFSHSDEVAHCEKQLIKAKQLLNEIHI